eukprot:TRINITY_DN1881_c1_g1_i3.p1 TRINITY_DN1881_c1_g1~~TRINITY_DN1881_c1_g1_i3.p1  ORF type:complete len:827 (+),score=100.81 TRINITY_DN1881_c1_g1_i3:1079-3559(+)
MAIPPVFDNVVPRMADLAAVWQRLIATPAVYNLYGLPGIGKTSLVRMLANTSDAKAHFPDGIYLISLTADMRITDCFSLINIRFQIRDEVTAKRWFGRKRCLIIVDNVPDTEFLMSFCSRIDCSHGSRVLAVSDHALGEQFASYQLAQMNPRDSTTLVAKAFQSVPISLSSAYGLKQAQQQQSQCHGNLKMTVADDHARVAVVCFHYPFACAVFAQFVRQFPSEMLQPVCQYFMDTVANRVTNRGGQRIEWRDLATVALLISYSTLGHSGIPAEIQARRRFVDLVTLKPNELVPFARLMSIWRARDPSLDNPTCVRIADVLVRRHFLTQEVPSSVRIHPLVHSFVESLCRTTCSVALAMPVPWLQPLQEEVRPVDFDVDIERDYADVDDVRRDRSEAVAVVVMGAPRTAARLVPASLAMGDVVMPTMQPRVASSNTQQRSSRQKVTVRKRKALSSSTTSAEVCPKRRSLLKANSYEDMDDATVALLDSDYSSSDSSTSSRSPECRPCPDPDADRCLSEPFLRSGSSLRSCTTALQLLKRHEHAWLFQEPVDPNRYDPPLTDYFDVVSQPMDFSTIQKKLSSKTYASAGEFAQDVNLVFSNCLAYNGLHSDIGGMAAVLGLYFASMFCSDSGLPTLDERFAAAPTSASQIVVVHKSTEVDSHHDTCASCHQTGTLLCCDANGCASAYHASCLEPPLTMIPDGDWFCPDCVELQGQPEYRDCSPTYEKRRMEPKKKPSGRKLARTSIRRRQLPTSQWQYDDELPLPLRLFDRNVAWGDKPIPMVWRAKDAITESVPSFEVASDHQANNVRVAGIYRILCAVQEVLASQ